MLTEYLVGTIRQFDKDKLTGRINTEHGNFGFGDPLGIGPELSLFLVTFAEAVCAFFVLIGLWTRIALIPLIINMVVIVFVAHAGDPFSDKELGLFFLIAWTTLFITGAGKYSLDEFFDKKKRRYPY